MERAAAGAWWRPAVITAQYIQYCFDTQPKAGPYTNYSWVEITLIYGSADGPIMYPSDIKYPRRPLKFD